MVPAPAESAMSSRAVTMRAVLVLTLTLVLAACAGVQVVPLGPAQAPVVPERVRVYPGPPKRYQQIARIETRSAIGFGTQGQTDAVIARLRREAARLGADGVILLGVGTAPAPVGVGIGTGMARRHVGVYGSVGLPTAQRHAVGIAIRVIEE